jgi:hypothetical protein
MKKITLFTVMAFGKYVLIFPWWVQTGRGVQLYNKNYKKYTV